MKWLIPFFALGCQATSILEITVRVEPSVLTNTDYPAAIFLDSGVPGAALAVSICEEPLGFIEVDMGSYAHPPCPEQQFITAYFASRDDDNCVTGINHAVELYDLDAAVGDGRAEVFETGACSVIESPTIVIE